MSGWQLDTHYLTTLGCITAVDSFIAVAWHNNLMGDQQVDQLGCFDGIVGRSIDIQEKWTPCLHQVSLKWYLHWKLFWENACGCGSDCTNLGHHGQWCLLYLSWPPWTKPTVLALATLGKAYCTCLGHLGQSLLYLPWLPWAILTELALATWAMLTVLALATWAILTVLALATLGNPYWTCLGHLGQQLLQYLPWSPWAKLIALALATLGNPYCTCLDYLGQLDPNRNHPIFLALPKVALARPVLSCFRGGFAENFNHKPLQWQNVSMSILIPKTLPNVNII